MLAIDAHFHIVAWRYIVDVGLTAAIILFGGIVVVGYFFGREVAPLAWAIGVVFAVVILYRIAQCVEFKHAVAYYGQAFALGRCYAQPAGVGMVTALLRTHIIIFHGIGCALVDAHHSAVIAVGIVFFGSASVVFHLIHFGGHAEANSHAGHVFLHGIAIGYGCKVCIHAHHSVGRHGVVHHIGIAGWQQITYCEKHICAFIAGLGCGFEVGTCLFPYLQTSRHAVAVIVICRSAPEVGLYAKSFAEIFHAIHLI